MTTTITGAQASALATIIDESGSGKALITTLANGSLQVVLTLWKFSIDVNGNVENESSQ